MRASAMQVWLRRGDVRMTAAALGGALVIAAPAPVRATPFFDSLRRVTVVRPLVPASPFLFFRLPPQRTPSMGIMAPRAAAPLPGLPDSRNQGLLTFAPPGHEGVGAEGISCVPFARAESGINLKGNAAAWWDGAAGVYSRGNRPEHGSVLVFSATGHMTLGHVAVVAMVVSARLITIDHANWSGSRGRAQHAVPVMDVSPANDWTMVRVGTGHDSAFGSPYTTKGFIYNRLDRGQMSADARH